MMTLIDELSSWVGTVAQRNDPDSQNLANCMRRAVAELERYQAEKAEERQAKVAHKEMYGRNSGAPGVQTQPSQDYGTVTVPFVREMK